MSDVIKLLPDNVANQIAAGEVIQRPASAVKELVENAIDAGSKKVSLIIKDAGKTLIQVIDDGVGMSDTDARLSFERHATSKIRVADDLYKLDTKGFRGEALASIAAIAQVELKTKRDGDDLGTRIVIEGSNVVEQEPCSVSKGSSFSIKNLFFNVPARRNFLKSNVVETKHIIEEFQKIALAHPGVVFGMHNNGNEVFNLPQGSFRQRIIAIFGDKFNQRLVPVEENTDIVSIDGFVGKPEFAKKTRGEQYFFVNDRYIKNAYLHHAVQNAFEHLLGKDQFPTYFLKMKVDPSKMDINIHPTKTEIKFEDERSIYAIIRTAVKQALGKFNVTPTLDFEQETSFSAPVFKKTDTIKPPNIKVNPNYNPFEKKTIGSAEDTPRKVSTQNWESLYSSFEKDTAAIVESQNNESDQQTISPDWNEEGDAKKVMVQLHLKYILTQLKSGVLIIDQKRAHQRVLYERFMRNLENGGGNSQQLLFPETIEFTSADVSLLDELDLEIKSLGFQMDKLGRNSFVVSGIPVSIKDENVKGLLESLLEQFKTNKDKLSMENQENMAISFARSACIKSGKKMTEEEMENLIDQLFACELPHHLPNGDPIIITLGLEDLNKQFNY